MVSTPEDNKYLTADSENENLERTQDQNNKIVISFQ